MYTRKELEEQIKNCEREISDLRLQIMTIEEKIGRAGKRLEGLKTIMQKGEYVEEG